MKLSNLQTSPRKIKFRNLIIIFSTIVIWLVSTTAFSGLMIWTNLTNAVQVIQRIIISADGTEDPTTKFYDINYNWLWQIKIYIDKMIGDMVKDKDRAKDSNNDRKILWVDYPGWDLIFLNKDVFSWALWWNWWPWWPSITWAQWPAWPTGPQWPVWPAWTNWTNWTNWINWTPWSQWPVWPTGPQWTTWATWPVWPAWPTGPQWTTWANWLAWTNWTNWINWTPWSQWPVWPTGPQWTTWFLQDWILWATPFWNGLSRTTTNTNIFNIWSNVWIWIPAWNQIPEKLNVNWAIKISDTSNTCTTTNEWSIRYKNKCFQWCDWSSRVDIVWTWCTKPDYQCQWTLWTWEISTSISIPPSNNITWNYNTTPWTCTYICDKDYVINTWTNYCCDLPDNSSLYQTWTTTVTSKRWTSLRWTSLRWINNVANQTGITYQGWNCNFVCNSWYVRNWDINNPICLPVVAPVCGRGQSLRWWTCHRGQ